jgi:multidrug efflux pump subunit AcrA (membrane-fusion protein)
MNNMPDANIISSFNEEEFMPSPNIWSIIGGWVIVGSFFIGLTFSYFIKFSPYVKSEDIQVVPKDGEIIVQSKITGEIDHSLAEGNHVKKGEKLANINNSDLELKADQLSIQKQQVNNELSGKIANLQANEKQIINEIKTLENQVEFDKQSTQESTKTKKQELEEIDRIKEDIQWIKDMINDVSGENKSELEKELEEQEKKLKQAIERNDESIKASQRKLENLRLNLAQVREDIQLARTTLSNQGQQIKIEQEKVKLELQKSLIFSPINGKIIWKNPKSIVQRNEHLFIIHPFTENLIIEAWIDSKHRDNVKIGYKTKVRIPSCDYTKYGSLKGTVDDIFPVVKMTTNSLETDGNVSNSTPINSPQNGKFKIIVKLDEESINAYECQIKTDSGGRVDILAEKKERILFFLFRKATKLID